MISKTLSRVYWEKRARVVQLQLCHLLNDTFCVKGCVKVHFCIHFQKASSSFAPAEHACLEQPKPNLVQRSPVFCCYKLCSIQHSNGRYRVRPALCTTACLKPGQYVSTLMVFFFFFFHLNDRRK